MKESLKNAVYVVISPNISLQAWKYWVTHTTIFFAFGNHSVEILPFLISKIPSNQFILLFQIALQTIITRNFQVRVKLYFFHTVYV